MSIKHAKSNIWREWIIRQKNAETTQTLDKGPVMSLRLMVNLRLLVKRNSLRL